MNNNIRRSNLIETIIRLLSVKTHKVNGKNKTYLEERYLGLFYYFFYENIKAIYGRVEVDMDEVEMLSTKEGLIINSIFTEALDIQCVEIDGYPTIIGKKEDKEVFKIEIGNSIITNELLYEKDKVTKKSVYKVDMYEGEFTYYDGNAESMETKSDDLDFIVALKPLNAKFKDSEMFEVRRIKPEEEKPASLLQKIFYNVKGNNYLSIYTSPELYDIYNFSDRIFDAIKELKQREEVKKLKNEK